MTKERSSESIYYANCGVERNKKHLRNIEYRIDIIECGIDRDPKEFKAEYAQYWFKDFGALVLSSRLEDSSMRPDEGFGWHGFVTPEYVKGLLGETQWSKFCQGKRRFVQQRRINGKNVKKEQKPEIL